MNDSVELDAGAERALQAIQQATLPDGMEERILLRLRVRQAEMLTQSAHTARKGDWWLVWLAGVATAIVLASVSAGHFRAVKSEANHAVNIVPQAITPAAPSDRSELPIEVGLTVQRSRPETLHSKIHHEDAKVSAAAFYAAPPLPHTAPPLSLSPQELLLLALARNSSLASTGVASNRLGPNALLELPHEPMPPFPANSISSGEDQ